MTPCMLSYFTDYGLGLVDVTNLPRGPSMSVEPVNVMVLSYGYDIYFECFATGNPAVNYSWTKDNETIKPAMDER